MLIRSKPVKAFLFTEGSIRRLRRFLDKDVIATKMGAKCEDRSIYHGQYVILIEDQFLTTWSLDKSWIVEPACATRSKNCSDASRKVCQTRRSRSKSGATTEATTSTKS